MRPIALTLALFLAVAAAGPAAAQKYQPKAIHFNGAPDYADSELLAASGMTQGGAYTMQEIRDHAQKLMDSGMFDNIAFKTDGDVLVFQLTPTTALYPVRLSNLPLPGPDLDAKLHGMVPLYHGKVPGEGGVLDAVRAALEQMLAAQGANATVQPIVGQGPGSATGPVKGQVMNFSITSPTVRVGEIQVDAKSTALDEGARAILAKLTGSPYDSVGSASQISTYLGNYYRDKGYAEAAIEAKQMPATAESGAAASIDVPFQASVDPGLLYRLGSVRLPPDSVVMQADFDRQSRIHPGDVAEGQKLTDDWQYISRQYHNKGYMQAKVHPTAAFDRFQRTVSYSVSVEPGPVYSMGKLAIENVAEDLRTAMLAAWKMSPGAVFSEGAIMSFYAIGDANPALARVFTSANCKYNLTLNDEDHTVDVVLRLEKKH